MGRRAVPRLEAFLEDHRRRFNEAGDRGVIHNFGAFRLLEAHRVEHHVDFGSARPNALSGWLHALAEAPLGALVVQVQLRGYPEPG